MKRTIKLRVNDADAAAHAEAMTALANHPAVVDAERRDRTIKLRVDVADVEAYADTVADIVSHPAVVESAWTRGEEIKDALATRHGMGVRWGKGALDSHLPD